jgi:hypothetical protein
VGYAGLLEIRRIREAIEHPTPDNTYRGRRGEWDHVPLAWMLSERAIEGSERWDEWFGQLSEQWTGALAARGPVIQTFEGVTRGVTSARQSKNPLTLRRTSPAERCARRIGQSNGARSAKQRPTTGVTNA